jgi:5-methylthioadenosine/S-adenosylhomocysteine deaminase
MQISIKAGRILTLNREFDVIKNGIVTIDDDKISYVGTDEGMFDKSSDYAFDWSNRILMPGFVNCHAHLDITSLRGLVEDLPLFDWLIHGVAPYEVAMNYEDSLIANYLGCCELIDSGITCVAEFNGGCSSISQVIEKTGLRAALNYVFMDKFFDEGENSNIDIKQTIRSIKHLKEKADRRITWTVGPHAPYSCSEDLMSACSKIASDLDVGIHFHLSESIDEVEWAKKKWGMSPVKKVDELGLLNDKTIAVHCVHLSNEDMELLSQRKVTVVHCPTSNAKLGNGVAPVREMMNRDINVCLGTDSAVSNNNLSIFKEMTLASLLQNVRYGKAGVISPAETIRMATLSGARCIGLQNQIGSIEVGKKADLITIDMGKVHLSPINDVYSSIVYSTIASDVDSVIIDGKVVKDGRILTVDSEKIVSLAEKSAERIRESKQKMPSANRGACLTQNLLNCLKRVGIKSRKNLFS